MFSINLPLIIISHLSFQVFGINQIWNYFSPKPEFIHWNRFIAFFLLFEAQISVHPLLQR